MVCRRRSPQLVSKRLLGLKARTPTRRWRLPEFESQAFVESRFGRSKKCYVLRAEWEVLDQARREIAAYVEAYHHRPHSWLGHRTTWRGPLDPQTEAT